MSLLRLIATSALLTANAAHAATLVVDRIDDDPGAMGCTSAALDCTLRGAVLFAELSPGPDDIVLPADTFEFTESGSGGAEAGDIEITTDITIRGAGRSETILTPGSNFIVERAFDVDDGGQLTLEDLSIIGFGIQDGLVFVTAPNLSGGAIRVADAVENRATLRRVRLADNRASLGGAITLGSNGDPGEPVRLTIVDSVIEQNEVDFAPMTSCVGGALYLLGHARLDRVVLEGNSVISGSGGAICVSGGQLSASDTVLLSNDVTLSRNGAGIYSQDAALDLTSIQVRNHTIIGGLGAALLIDGGSAVITDSEFSNNTSRSSGITIRGGAEVDIVGSSFIANGTYQLRVFGSVVTMDDTRFTGSGGPGVSVVDSVLSATELLVEGHRSESGGGLSAELSQIFLHDCTFRNNRAADNAMLSGLGGALYIEDGVLELIGCTLHDNSAIAGGGALTLDGASFSVLRNSTFGNNEASSAESIQALVSNNLTLDHLTLAGSNDDSQIELINSSVQMTNNAIDGFCNLTLTGGTAISGGGNIVTNTSCDLAGVEDRLVADLSLLSFGDFGGPTGVFLPSLGSPLIDNASANCTGQDQRGQPRGTPCSAGSVERQPSDEFVFSDGFE